VDTYALSAALASKNFVHFASLEERKGPCSALWPKACLSHKSHSNHELLVAGGLQKWQEKHFLPASP
jgi:hypothetical protein